MSESKEQRRVTLQVHLGLIEEQIKHLLDLDSQLTNPEEQKDAPRTGQESTRRTKVDQTRAQVS
jgi:hypothetical protein